MIFPSIKKYAVIFCLVIIFSCSSAPAPRYDSVVIPEDFFGIVHAGTRRTAEEYQFLDELGARWVLDTFYWGVIEREQGVFDFSYYDDYVDTAIRQNRKVAAVLGYEAPWLTPHKKRYISPDNIPHFLNFVRETVQHFKGRVNVWSIWNEPNFVFWNGPAGEFYELTVQTAQVIRETDPGCDIIGGVFWRTPARFIKNMHKAGAMKDLDGLAFHPYAITPSGAMKLHDKFLDVLEKLDYSGPVWITEVGYPTGGWYPTRVSLNKNPSYIVKTIAGLAVRGARVLFWYELFDSQNEGETSRTFDTSEKFFGLAYPDYQRKSGSWAYELCARFLPGSRYVPEYPLRENIPSNIVSFCFTNSASGYNTLILWNNRNKNQKINLYLPGSAVLYDISSGKGNPLGSEISLDVGSQPLIITWQETGVPRLFIPK